MVVVSPKAFWALAEAEIGSKLSDRTFKAHFGCRSNLIAEMWHRIDKPEGSRPVHLLWAFAFLKMYEKEDCSATRFHTTSKTWRKWV